MNYERSHINSFSGWLDSVLPVVFCRGLLGRGNGRKQGEGLNAGYLYTGSNWIPYIVLVCLFLNPLLYKMNLFFWRKPQPIQVRVITRDRSKLTLTEFRSDEKITNSAAKVLNDPMAQIMIDVLKSEHPAFAVYHPETDLQVRAAHQARCEGYTMAIRNLESMGQYQKPTETIEPTFEKEEIN